jgi:GH15 family glucan-1,4-alpha-glucosidase
VSRGDDDVALRIEDYALIGDCQTAALVGRDGSIDWLCFPRFDSGACFAALLGTPEHGRWLLAPAVPVKHVRRRYRPGTLVLETEFDVEGGTVRLVDCMPPRSTTPDVVRMVVGVRGRVPMRMHLVIRYDYGSIVPWVRKIPRGIQAIAGPDTLLLRTAADLRGVDLSTVAEFAIAEGEEIGFDLTWHPSHEPMPEECDVAAAIHDTTAWWSAWSDQCTHEGPWRDAVLRSLITLKAMTYAPTGGIVAAPTTSLPEWIGGVRNWDYRYCWIRDATFTLYALMLGGYLEEAKAWREWLLRAVAGNPGQIQIMYGLAGERRLTELTLGWLPGYEGSAPVRIGNAAHQQFQLDIFGEVIDALHVARRHGLAVDDSAWRLERELVERVASVWTEPDEGLWEVRGPRRHFTHSKVMAWVALDRAVKDIGRFGLDGPAERWAAVRDQIHAEICAKAYDSTRNTFVQSYGSDHLDASLLMMALVGFLPPSDPRIRGTVEAIERELVIDGFVARYPTTPDVDGLPPGEGTFLACSFWFADNLAMIGRRDDARRCFERLVGLANDVGLLSEEYDPDAKRLVGNFPQAYSHVALTNTAYNLSREPGPADIRPKV